MHKLLIIVPAFNEEESLPTTLQSLQAYPYDIAVVNDGSVDRTARIARQFGAALIDLPFNQGLAGAFTAGMQYAEANGYSHALQFDADGQHLPQYITPMLEKITAADADILIGSRFLTQSMPRSLRTFGSLLIRAMVKITTGQRLTDPTSGMRMYSRRMIELFAKRPDLTPEPDTIAYLMRCGAKVCECEVTMHERIAGTSYLGSWSAVRYMIRMALSIMMIQFVRTRIRKEAPI